MNKDISNNVAKNYQLYEEIKALLREHKPNLASCKYDKFIKALVEVLDL